MRVITDYEIFLPLLKEQYQDGHEKADKPSGHKCEFCKPARYFDSLTILRGHQEAVHQIPDPTLEASRSKWRKFEKRRRERGHQRVKRQA